MSWTEKLGKTVKASSKKAGSFLVERMEQAASKRVCLGISGLSRSGKSTFITSLINQLVNFDRSEIFNNRSDLCDKIVSVQMLPLESSGLKPFPYQEAYHRLASTPPLWPQSTNDLSGLLLEIKIKNSGLTRSLSDHRTVYLEIRDYPGEWLLDLPLMRTDYLNWCRQCSVQYDLTPRRNHLGQLHQRLYQIDPLAKADCQNLNDMSQQFVDFLKLCKSSEQALSLVQPGRFLFAGNIYEAPEKYFVPLLNTHQYKQEDFDQASPDSYYHLCKTRYESYVQTYVKPFFKAFFQYTDRQIVLVDIIGALYGGPDYFDDMQNALIRISECFSYGPQSFFGKLFSPKIDRLVFAASKIDQVIHEDHEDVKTLLSNVVRKANQFASSGKITTYIEAIAAVRATCLSKNSDQPGVEGHTLEGKRIRFTNPSIPKRIPETPEQWERFLTSRLPHLAPPEGLSEKNSDVISHIRMNTVVERLLEDKLL